MALGYIMRPQLSGGNRLGRAGQDRDFLLDKNASLEPMDCEQFDLLSATNTETQIHISSPEKAHTEAGLTINLLEAARPISASCGWSV
jgi:hypothetical protein